MYCASFHKAISPNLLRPRPWRVLSFFRTLRKLHADLAVLPNTVSYSVTSAIITRLSGAPWRAGTESISFGHRASSLALNLTVPHPGEDLHESERNLAAVRPLGITTDDLSPLYVPSAAEVSFAASFLQGIDPGRPVVLVHVGAGKIPNRWPAERFAELIRLLVTQARAVVILTAGPGEERLIERARQGARLPAAGRESSSLLILRSRSLGELAAVAARVDLYVGNDTGPLHLAAAVGATVLALLGPTEPRRWLPRTPRTHFLRAPAGDLRQLGLDHVWKKVGELLREVPGGETA